MPASASASSLAPELASEAGNVAAALGISPEELIDRAVRHQLARQLLDGVFDRAGGLDPDEALRLVNAERDASRSQPWPTSPYVDCGASNRASRSAMSASAALIRASILPTR